MGNSVFILGLTGSIGMGKSATSAMFRRAGIPVYDADAAVHQAYGKGGAAVTPIAEAFGDVVKNGAIDRTALAAKVLGKPGELRRLEAIIHPIVGAMQRRFLRHAAHRRRRLVVLDIPLLMEGRGESRTDAVAVVSAPFFIQKQRVLARPNMTLQKFENIYRQQVPDRIKRARADFIILSSRGRRPAWLAVQNIIRITKNRPGHVWPATGRSTARPGRHPSRRAVHRRNWRVQN